MMVVTGITEQPCYTLLGTEHKLTVGVFLSPSSSRPFSLASAFSFAIFLITDVGVNAGNTTNVDVYKFTKF